MIVLDKEMAYISLYLAEKEYFLPDNLRSALSYIYYLIHKKGKSKSLAIHITNEKYKKLFNVEYGKEFLWKNYNARLAHIKNGKDKYQKWALDIRERNAGLKVKLCECGCGQEVTKKNNRFINGHNSKCRDENENIERAALMRSIRKSKKSGTVISLIDRIPKNP